MSSNGALSHINTVLFDLDGTLLDSNELIAESWLYTIKALTGEELPVEDIYTTFGEMLIDSMKRLMPGVDAKRARDVYREYQQEIFLDRIKLFDGVKETLERLRTAGVKSALVTSRLRNSTEKALAHFNIIDLFDAILTANDTEKHKPDPTPVFMILDMIDSKPEEAMLVGDTKHDIEAGQAAGVITALVDWSVAIPSEKRSEEPTPDYIFQTMLDIPLILDV